MSVNLLDLAKQYITPETVASLSNNIGADQGATQSALNAILPSLLGGLTRNASDENGAASLLQALDRDHDGSVLNDVVGFFSSGGAQAREVEGGRIVQHVLGQDQEAIQNGISQSSGLDMGQIGSLMAQFAPVVLGLLGQQKQQNGLDLAGLMNLLGGQRQNLQQEQQQQAGGLDVMGLLTGFLDQNKDGSMMDEAMGMLGNLFKK